jgi:hypothetical protein
MPSTNEPLLTLEPLIDAVRDGVSGAGWKLSGLQKTTSHQFEGRWDGESSRSAYLFFHSDRYADFVSVDVFLDETTKGLRGNLALVVEGPELSGLGPMKELLSSLAHVCAECLPEGYRTPLTVRLRLDGPDQDPDDAESEVRLKLRIPATAMKAGGDAVSALASGAVAAFELVLVHEDFGALRHDG